MSSSSVSPRTPSLPSAAAPNTDVAALMPNHPPSLKFHTDTRLTDSCEPYRLLCIHLTDFDFLLLASALQTELVWALRRDAYQWMTDLLGHLWEGERIQRRGRRFRFRYLPPADLCSARMWKCVKRRGDSEGGRWTRFNFTVNSEWT